MGKSKACLTNSVKGGSTNTEATRSREPRSKRKARPTDRNVHKEGHTCRNEAARRKETARKPLPTTKEPKHETTNPHKGNAGREQTTRGEKRGTVTARRGKQGDNSLAIPAPSVSEAIIRSRAYHATQSLVDTMLNS